MEWWNSTLTIFHRTKVGNTTKWVRNVVKHCFYGHQRSQNVSGVTLVSTDTHVVRIPCHKNVVLHKGDIVVDGEITVNIGDNSSGNDIFKNHDGFIVKTVKNNNKVNPKHIYGGG